MLATLIIVFREVIEAGLVVGIVLAATRHVPHTPTPWSTNDHPIELGSTSLDYIVKLTPSFNIAPISKEQFRAMNPKGNFGGQVLPGLGLSTHDSLFDPMTPWYPETTQQAIFAAKRAAGLNTINLCSWANYHGSEFGMPVSYAWCDDPQAAKAYCINIRKAGFIPMFWLLGDLVAGDSYDENGGHLENTEALLRRMVPALKGVVGAFSPGYELRGCCGASGAPYSAKQYWQILQWIREMAPDVYLIGHFASENSAGSSHSPVEAADPWQGNEIDFWTEVDWPIGSTLLDGFFYQAPTDNKLFGPTEDWRDRWQECIDRIGAGNHIWPPACTTKDLIWGEAGWYNITRGDNTEAQIVSISDKALAMGGRWSFSG